MDGDVGKAAALLAQRVRTEPDLFRALAFPLIDDACAEVVERVASGLPAELRIDAVAEIIRTLGGPAALGRMIGKSTEHATIMRRRGSIPVRYWDALLRSAAEAGIALTAADLLRAHTAGTANYATTPVSA